MEKSVVTYVLLVYMDGTTDYTLKNEFPASQYGGEENALSIAKSVGMEFNKQGHDYAIMKETITPVNYILSKRDKGVLTHEQI